MIYLKNIILNKILILCFPIFLYAVSNPYTELKIDEKVNLLVNFFLNKELKNIIPKEPIKESIKDDSPINPIKYELYFSYIQRLKAINDSRAQEQKDIDEKYAGKIGFYNGKLKTLKKYYNKEENLHPILQNSFNKVYKILYGKPKLKDVSFDPLTKKVTATVWVGSIYGYLKWDEKKITIDIPEDIRDIFIEENRMSKIFLNYDFTNNILKLKNLTILYDEKLYKANFVNKINKSIKLVIKINDDIFRLVKIEDKK
ncbi:MAG: hypothetical protein U9R39_09550 [Campylobacterota bacterium]|nr:hypothetical protein [Campylobacterota bacterium]